MTCFSCTVLPVQTRRQCPCSAWVRSLHLFLQPCVKNSYTWALSGTKNQLHIQPFVAFPYIVLEINWVERVEFQPAMSWISQHSKQEVACKLVQAVKLNLQLHLIECIWAISALFTILLLCLLVYSLAENYAFKNCYHCQHPPSLPAWLSRVFLCGLSSCQSLDGKQSAVHIL